MTVNVGIDLGDPEGDWTAWAFGCDRRGCEAADFTFDPFELPPGWTRYEQSEIVKGAQPQTLRWLNFCPTCDPKASENAEAALN